MHQNNLSHHNTSMQAHLTCHLQQENIQDILHQSKFYFDNRRSHIPESKCFKFQQEIWAEKGDRKFVMKNSKSTGLSNGGVFFREREGNGRGGSKWRARGAHTCPWRGQGASRATTWCGRLVGPPGLPQVPLCPFSCVKNFYTFSGIFRETLFLGNF